MKKPKLYKIPPKDCWAWNGEQWHMVFLLSIDVGGDIFRVQSKNDNLIWFCEKITYENPTEKRLPTKAELVELLKKHPQLRVREKGDSEIWHFNANEIDSLDIQEFTLDLGDTFHSFKRDWSEELERGFK